ncbi:MAG: YARHG domain-containing protein [Aureispira sp.]
MTKTLLLLLGILSYFNATAQKLDNCTQCSSKKYEQRNLTENKLYEIVLLRNEIFARHHYSFKNQRLQEYYEQYNWYHPYPKQPIKQVHLNSTEQWNVDLFKAKEKAIKKNRALLENALKQLKQVIVRHDEAAIQTIFNNVVEKSSPTLYLELVRVLEKVFRSININDINWHKGRAQYEIRIDNGFSISSKSIHLEGNTISVLYTNPMTNSSLMEDDAFEYPSDYHSEEENTIGAEFELKNGKLLLVRLILAG